MIISATLGDFWPFDMVRAKENGVWFAVAGTNRLSGTPYPPSRIYDPAGELLCSCGNEISDSFAFADIDFNRRYYQHWASVGPCEGEPPSLYITERRPETYKI